VNVLGGVMGELILLLSTLYEMKNDPSTPNFSTITFAEENMEKFIYLICRDIFREGTVELGIHPDTEANLKKKLMKNWI